MTILPADPTNLVAQVRAAAPGDAVALATGTYPAIGFKLIEKADPGVLILPAEGATPVLTQGIECSGCAGLHFDQLVIGRSPRVNMGVYMTTCRNMALTRSTVFGPDDVEKMIGVNLRNTQNVLIRGNDIHNVAQGIAHLECAHVEIDGNDIHHLRGAADAIRGIASFLKITNNRGWSFYAQAGWHTDFIQLWTTGLLEAPHDILIEGNEFRQMDGAIAQGVFCGDESGVGYQRIVVRDNCIAGASYNGITVSHADDGLIEDNVVFGFTDSLHTNGKIIVPWVAMRSAVNGTIQRNITTKVVLISATGVALVDNQIIPNQTPGDYAIADAWRERREEGSDCERAKFLRRVGGRRSRTADIPDPDELAWMRARDLDERLEALEVEGDLETA